MELLVLLRPPKPTAPILIGNHRDREKFEKLTDAELLRLAARDVAMAVVIIVRTNSGTSNIIGEHQCRRGG
jgi:hypothetical protein